MNSAYLSLGTNLGNREENLKKAIEKIEERVGHVKAQSAFLPTEPWGFESSHSFLNAAVCVETDLTPFELLKATQTIEREMGRTVKSVSGGYADRIIDIDILLYYTGDAAQPVCDKEKDWGGSVRIESPELTIPHPLMHKRDFVLIPLKEIL